MVAASQSGVFGWIQDQALPAPGNMGPVSRPRKHKTASITSIQCDCPIQSDWLRYSYCSSSEYLNSFLLIQTPDSYWNADGVLSPRWHSERLLPPQGSSLSKVALPPSWVDSFLSSIHPILCPSIHDRSHLHTAGFSGTSTIQMKQHVKKKKSYVHTYVAKSPFTFHMQMISIYTHSVLSSSRPVIGAPINKEQSDAWISADLFSTRCKCE